MNRYTQPRTAFVVDQHPVAAIHSPRASRRNTDAYLGATSAGNLQVFAFAVVSPNMLLDRFVSFTATNAADNTSEMGTCYPLAGGGDTIFKNSFED